MNQAVVHLHPAGALVALVGNPNCGKTALFNLLTGSRQKVANYAGVTVERKEGRLLGTSAPGLRTPRVLDLPGAYSLYPRSPDERITADVLAGRAVGERKPDLVVCVVDATSLRRNLRLVLAVLRQGLPVVVALNMSDLADQRGQPVDAATLSAALGVPVVATIGVKSGGDAALRALIADRTSWPPAPAPQPDPAHDDSRVRALLDGLGLAAHIKFSPAWNTANFKAPFTSANGWGTYAQKKTGTRQLHTLHLKYGELKLQELAFTKIGSGSVKRVSVMLGTQHIPVQLKQNGAELRITINKKISVKTNERLNITFS